MANQFVALPAPAGNGSGAPVDVSSFGGIKTVTNTGNGGAFEPAVTIEFSNELVPVHFAPLWTFGKPGEKVVVVAARWMRATVSNYRGGGAPVVSLGGNDAGALFANLPVPAGNGAGAAVDVSVLSEYRTIHVAKAFRGALNIELSEDGGASWSQLATFYGPGAKSLIFVSEFMRVTRVGVPRNTPGQPDVNIGAVEAGGGEAGIVIQDEGVPIAIGKFDTLNFVGAGVTASDAGAGKANISIPGGGGILFWGCDNVGGAAASRYLPPGYEIGLAPTVPDTALPVPRAGTLKNLFVRHNAAGGNGNPVAYTVFVNGAPSAITCMLNSGAIGGASDIVHTVAVVAGDRVSIVASKPGGAIGGGVVDVNVSLEVG